MRAVVAFLAVVLVAVQARAGGGPAETVVLVNADSAESRRVAEHYVRVRNVPPSQVCEVRCTAELTTTIEDFVRDVVDPLRLFLAERELEERVRFVVMTQGMPILAKTPSGRSVSTSAALSLLDSPVCGQSQTQLPAVKNPYTSGPAAGARVETGGRFLLVTALVSTTADEAIALVDRSLASDGTAPKDALFVFQDANPAAHVRNVQYDAARQELERMGFRTEHAKVGAKEVNGRKRVMGYMSGGAYSALSVEGVASIEYLPGAITDLLQSFGSVPQNFTPDTKDDSQFPVTHMVRAGVTGVHGAVAEPYNIAFPDARLFVPYVQGFTLAESYHQRTPFAYWMNLVQGDPLCAPYAERPVVKFEATGKWTGVVPLSVAAPKAVAIQVFVDGRLGGEIAADAGTVEIDTATLADGPHHLLVEAKGPGESEPRGWAAATVEVRNPALRPLARPSRVAKDGTLRVPLSRAPSGDERPVVELRTADGPVAGRCRVDGASVVFEPAATAVGAASATDAALLGCGEPCRWTLVPAPAAFRIQAPATVTAGDTFALQAVPVDAAGNPLTAWRGRVEIRSVAPPVRWACASAGDGGSVDLPLKLTKAGDVQFVIASADDPAAAARHAVRVDAGPPHHATTPLSTFPLGQEADMEVVVEDEFGNRAASFDGTLALAAPADPHAKLPEPVRIAPAQKGRGVFRRVLLTRAGPQPLAFRDADGSRTWSIAGEGITVERAPLRPWLVAGPASGDAATRLVAGDPSDEVDADGAVSDGWLWRSRRDAGNEVVLAAGNGADGDAAAAVTFVEALGATKVRLLAAAPARLRVFVDGKSVFDGVPNSADPRKKREPIAEIDLKEGAHRIAVVAERKGRFSFALEMDDGKGAFPPVRVRALSGESPKSPAVSGVVRVGASRTVAGAKVTLRTTDGREHSATTAADGTWFLTSIPAGEAVVRVDAGARAVEPAERRITVEDAHVVDVDFTVRDITPPQIALPASPRPLRFGRTIVVVPEARDDDAVGSLRATLGGRPLGEVVRHAPWEIRADASALPRGRHELVLTVVDASGNEATVKGEVVLVADGHGPVVKLKGLAANAVLKKRTDVVATVTDDLPVVELRFALDGKDLGAPLAREPWQVTLDPAAVQGEGRHELVAIAKDLDGNESRTTLRFTTR